MESFFYHIIETSPIMGNTINGWIDIPKSFMYLIYAMFAIIIIVATVYFLLRDYDLLSSTRYGIIIAFFSTGILYAIQADNLWRYWLFMDLSKYFTLSSANKSLVFDENLYRFASGIKTIIGNNDYSLYSTIDDTADTLYLSKRLEYYLLPSRKREKANYVVVLDDKSAFFDESSGIFRSSNIITRAELLFYIGNNAYLLRIKS